MRVLFVTVRMKPEYRDRILKAALAAHRAAPHYPARGNLPADWFIGQKAVVIRGAMIAPSEAECR